MTGSTSRSFGLFIVLALAVIIVLADYLLSASVYRTNFYSGWILLSIMLILAAFNLRKKI